MRVDTQTNVILMKDKRTESQTQETKERRQRFE